LPEYSLKNYLIKKIYIHSSYLYEHKNIIMDIKVLGTGCAKCKTLERITKEAVEELNLDASVEKIEDIQKIMEYGVMFTPALVVDGEVLIKGRVPNLKEMKKILTQ